LVAFKLSAVEQWMASMSLTAGSFRSRRQSVASIPANIWLLADTAAYGPTSSYDLSTNGTDVNRAYFSRNPSVLSSITVSEQTAPHR